MKAVIYMRVSTRDQNTSSQLDDCLELALARGFETVTLREEVASGVAKARPAWEEVKELARRGKVGAVIVWSLDRVGRSMFRTIADVGELDGLGVRVVSVREPWLDTGGPASGLLLAIFAWVAQHEHERIRERTRAGLEVARAKGVRLGRPPGIEAEVVAAAAEMRARDMTWSQIRWALGGEYSKGALERAVSRLPVPEGEGATDPADES